MFLGNPVARPGDRIRIVMLLDGQARERALVGLGPGLAFVRTVPVVVEMQHLGLEQRQHPLVVANEGVAVSLPPLVEELLFAAEETRVIRHVEHPEERNLPRVVGLIPPQDGNTAMDPDGDLCVPTGTEHRRRAAVRVDQ